VLGGLWPIASGRIAKPIADNQYTMGRSQDIFYVPQQPYTALGTLRDQIIYPLTLEDAISKMCRAHNEGFPFSSDTKFYNTIIAGVHPIYDL
jgi:ABC-type uncharacterized transport system fused permease/ATPase subunit